MLEVGVPRQTNAGRGDEGVEGRELAKLPPPADESVTS